MSLLLRYCDCPDGTFLVDFCPPPARSPTPDTILPAYPLTMTAGSGNQAVMGRRGQRQPEGTLVRVPAARKGVCIMKVEVVYVFWAF